MEVISYTPLSKQANFYQGLVKPYSEPCHTVLQNSWSVLCIFSFQITFSREHVREQVEKQTYKRLLRRIKTLSQYLIWKYYQHYKFSSFFLKKINPNKTYATIPQDSVFKKYQKRFGARQKISRDRKPESDPFYPEAEVMSLDGNHL